MAVLGCFGSTALGSSLQGFIKIDSSKLSGKVISRQFVASVNHDL
jgi:hypothetical protein